ncbi:type II toxin-antitoxin system VapC family toxin [Microlunatus speluncae]|uniref:type II toxin-antitoxin system VapC family toxin n=1 Tax=Microlunatus speluncae TaxID=2594267 RepID=UPI0012661B18|nr:PIN domain-containing protein [Microlunatus speluncae]
MTVLVDTSVWSLALRRDAPAQVAEVEALRSLLAGSDLVLTTGIIVQELLQGILPGKTRATIVERFAGLSLIQPELADHIAAAELRNTCRHAGVQLGTVDALIAQLAIRQETSLLTADQDFAHAARHIPLRLWRP